MWKLQDLESAVIWSEKDKDEAEIVSRVGGAERTVLYFGLFESDEKKFSFWLVES